MKVDQNLSRYQESMTLSDDFTRQEIQTVRVLLRRLRFLEAKVRQDEERGGISAPGVSGGAMFAEQEMLALAWVLQEVGFLETEERR